VSDVAKLWRKEVEELMGGRVEKEEKILKNEWLPACEPGPPSMIDKSAKEPSKSVEGSDAGDPGS
jgi:hypothetical protein